PRRKGFPPKKEDKRKTKGSIYIIWFARVRETQKERKRNRMRREKKFCAKRLFSPKKAAG
ncbi:hypothetical protein CLI73_09905, partial [Porphyromonas gingivalis]